MGTLSPNGGGFREELPCMRRRGYFCPRKRYLPGRNRTPESTLSPNGGGFREEMPSGRRGGYFCPQKRPFPGRERGVCCICRENREVLPIGVPRRYSQEVFPGGVGLFLFAQFICLGYGRDDVREDVFFAKFLCKSHFIEVCKDIVVYTAEDYLYVLFL